MRALPSIALVILFCAAPLDAQQKEKPKWPPSQHVAATPPLRPEEQIKKMKLPPGFEIQLVASDPDIRKPINIAFDAAGRLWVTETIEYPYAAAPGKGRDAVKILEDFGPDGRARKITTFADKLNIPIGIIPTTKGALVYSIPAIYHMMDTKGTGQADVREPYYTGFGYKDTHGMTGEFQAGFDGWIYGCHGFSNNSTVKSKGDSAISMTSGNTYRIKADGSRIEHYTHGQVNPFGLSFDPYGNLYSGDCHSQPLTMLIRGALYQHFGNKHDGLGFGPHMNTFSKHSTALCGVTYYAANQYPKEYQGKLFLGDVVLNRLNSYRLEWNGTTPNAYVEDFITSSDPWFRPVDIKLGPDGCLYVADFYNRIIGHYEVPLDHPGRDRDKGRIWRIVYRGKDGSGEPQRVNNIAKADVKALVQTIGHTNLSVRLHAADQLVERGNEAVASLLPIVKDVADLGNGAQKVHALWVLERLGKLTDETLAQASSAKEKEVRVHAQRILTEKKNWTPKYAAMAKLALLDSDPFVKRVALEALSAHPAVDHIAPILAHRHTVNSTDSHMLYAVRLALRNHLRELKTWDGIGMDNWSEKDHRAVADVCLGVHTEASAEYLKTYLTRFFEFHEQMRPLVHYIVRRGAEGAPAWAVQLVRKKFPESGVVQAFLVKAIIQANQERGGTLTDADRKAFEAMVEPLLVSPNAVEKDVGAELAGILKLARMQPDLYALVRDVTTVGPLRKTCIASLVSIDAQQAVPTLTQLLLNEKETIAIREQVANALAGTNHPDAHAALVKALQNTPARLQTTIALGMAGTPQGGDRLLQAIETGKASSRLLQDQTVVFRLQTAKIGNVKDRLKKLTQGLAAPDQKAQELIAKRRDAFGSFKADIEVGQKIFQKQCEACHQIANQGAKIGPQLDGIGLRGLERLLEDVLDPNRNVDQAFRTTIITTKAGQTVIGLFLREEGQVVILADAQGKEVRIEKKSIDERALSVLSPMPGNVAELVNEAEFHHLMAYLLSQRGK